MKKLLYIALLTPLLSLRAAARQSDSCAYYRRRCDTLMHKRYIAQKQLEAVKFFIKVVEHRPADIKFLKGWLINRALIPNPKMTTK